MGLHRWKEVVGSGIPHEIQSGLHSLFFSTKPGGQSVGLTLDQEILSLQGSFSLKHTRPCGPPCSFLNGAFVTCPNKINLLY